MAEQDTSAISAGAKRQNIPRGSHTSTSDRKIAAALFLGIFLFSALSPVATSFDSRWTVYTVMSMWERHDTNLDEYMDAIRANADYAIECVEPNGEVHKGSLQPCAGHFYSRFSIGGPLLASPIVLAEIGILKLTRPLTGGIHSADPTIKGFLAADYSAGHALLEMEAASLILAISAILVFYTSRPYLSATSAVVLTLLFAFGTSAYSSGGRALWSNTISMALVALTVFLLDRADQAPKLAVLAGLPVALSYTVRPTNALLVVIATGYVAFRHRNRLIGYLACAAPVTAIFFWYSLTLYKSLRSPYYQSSLDGLLPENWTRLGEALVGNLFSPGRGLFVFTPILLFAAFAMVSARWKSPLAPWVSAWAVLHWISVSAYLDRTWGGHSYGPRLFTDLTPVLVLFLIPWLKEWNSLRLRQHVVFVTLAVLSVGIHLRGGWSGSVIRWNTDPSDINDQPERNWDWKDPQFLRGLYKR